jgi:hypothetical protein
MGIPVWIKSISKIDSLITFLHENPQRAFYHFKALHIYGFDPRYSYSDIELINYTLNHKFENFFQNRIAFAQDLFGNQFCFVNDGSIILVNIETLEIEAVSSNFDDFDKVIFDRANYLTAWPLAEKWIEVNNNEFNFNERLCPKIPFVLGGEFSASNLYQSDIFMNISFCAELYHQIKEIPDGTNYILKVKW